MNNWTENFRISETGIYFVDNRSVWGGKYVESLIWHEPVEDNDDSEINGNGNEIQMFSRGLCIGDSITEGVFNYDSGQTVIKKYSYPTLLQRITGIDIVNAGIGGLTAETWYNASIDSNTQYGKWLNNEWVWNMNPTVGTGDIVSDLLNYSGFDFSVIHLGINDIYLMGDKAIDDVIANFETNIYNIINKLKTANKGIKIFLCTIIPSYAVPGDTNYEAINAKIKEIAEATEEVYLIDLNKYSKCTAGSPYAHIHLTALGYRQMASEISAYISYIISQNLEDFKWVQFIGTDYSV
jgi:lysophospholipase L1-like esterase